MTTAHAILGWIVFTLITVFLTTWFFIVLSN